MKCLCFYHPGDPPELKERQEAALVAVQDACRTTGRELLIEIIASKHGVVAETTAADVLERLYAVGLKPDWWKLEPQTSAAGWRAIEDAIRAGDPYCRGVVLLGLEAPEEELVAAFRLAAQSPAVKGFAIGRTIFAAGGGEMACRIDAGRRGCRRDGGAVRKAVPGVGPGRGRCEEGCMRGWRTPSPRLRGEAELGRRPSG